MAIDIRYCGLCHADVHQVRNDWSSTVYPCLPGHEIVGRVTAVGPQVTRHKVGDLVAVGCMADSCQHCASCAAGEEQYCENGSLAETQEVLDFCAQHGITADVELIDT